MDQRRWIRDVSRVSRSKVSSIGFTAGMVTAFFFAILHFSGLLSISQFESTFSSITNPFELFIIAAALSCAFAHGYGFIFKSARRSGIAVGMTLAMYHWLADSVAVGLFTSSGIFLLKEGLLPAFTFMLGHLIYGAAVGVFFDRAAIRFELPRPISNARYIEHRYQTEERASQRMIGIMRSNESAT